MRGVEAHLIALCSHGSEDELLSCCQQVAATFQTPMQFAVGASGENDTDVDGLIRTALRTLSMRLHGAAYEITVETEDAGAVGRVNLPDLTGFIKLHAFR